MMRVLWLTGLIIVVDQATKLLVLQTMYLGQQISLIGDWLKFTFTENPGMAFGITVGPRGLVTMFSIIATILIIFYLYRVRNDYYPYRASLALILGGAVGNIIDRVFYGTFFKGEPLFFGKVVDFIHVNLWSGFIAESIPFIGGTYISLFPIWNVADMAIVVGVVGIIAFQNRHQQELYERELALRGPDVDVPAGYVADGDDRENARSSS
ncbi:MAG: signal peptidase II [Rhodothermales bacterium]